MKRLLAAAAALVLISGTAGAASAQPRFDNHRDDHRRPAMAAHHGWRQGGRIERGDWARGRHVDYRAHHLRAPPRGYEWREVDGNYVLAAAATGLIASILAASH